MESHIFELPNFMLECGVTLPIAKIAFATHGALNDERNNVVLLPSWYSSGHHSYDFLIGPDRAIDPSRYFVIETEMFANGFSSSPSNTPPPFDGPRFPPIAIRDNVKAAYRLLTEHFALTHLKAVIGFSMGGQQAYQWAVSYPDFMDAIVSLCGAAKTYPHGFVRLESAISALTADPLFNNGDYTAPLVKGFTAWSNHWAAWVFSQEWWRRELYKETNPTVAEFLSERASRTLTADANNLISQAVTWQQHSVGDTPSFNGDQEQALRSIKARVLSMPGQTDLYFPIGDAEYERQFIKHVTFTPIPSIRGHTAGGGGNPEDSMFLNKKIGEFLQ